MTHEDLPGYLKTLLPEDFLTFDMLSHWTFGPADTGRMPDPPDIGIGNLARLMPVHPLSGFPAHRPDHFQLLYMLSGSFTLFFDKGREICRLSEGDAVLLAPGYVRSVSPCGKEDFGISVAMEPRLLREVLDLATLPALSQFLNLYRGVPYVPDCPYLLFHTEVHPMAGWYIEELACEHFAPDRRTYLAFQDLLHLALICLDRCVETNSRSHRTPSAQTADAVVRYLKTYYTTATLSETARRFGFSPNYLSHLLKQITGLTFQELKQNISLSQSAHMLETSDDTVAEIAAAVGMGNLTRFYRLFAEQYGMTPARYRKEHRAAEHISPENSET